MPKYLIEVSHKNSKKACDTVVSVFQSTGSHFLTNANFGCHDDVHKAWIIAEVDTKVEARRIVPPAFRDDAKVVKVDKLAMEKIDDYKKMHKK